MKLSLAVLLAALAVASCHPDATLPTGAAPGHPRLVRAGSAAVPGRYIVVLRDGAESSAARARGLLADHGGSIRHRYRRVLNGFSASLTPTALAALLEDPAVAYVSEEQWLHAEQSLPPWGVDRSDQRDLPLSGSYAPGADGAGVTMYVIDSGIRTTHNEFGGRASVGVDFLDDGRNGQDCSGHGTHIAATAGGATYGIARAVALVSVRVLPCSGPTTDAIGIAAVEWVTENAVPLSVVNMSLGGSTSEPLREAVEASIASGIPYVVAAGNRNEDACLYLPAAIPAAITVGASTREDAQAYFSSWGTCLDLYAPGLDILSAGISSNTAAANKSGTSMSTPHVTGAAALYLQGHPSASPAQVESALVASATRDRLTLLSPGSPNRLLFTGGAAERTRLSPLSLAFTVVRAGEATSSGGTLPLSLTNYTSSASGVELSRSQPWLTLAASASVPAASTVQVPVSVSVAALPLGRHEGQVIAAVGGDELRAVVSLEVVPGSMLVSGFPREGMAGASGERGYYAVRIPAGADSLVVRISGGTGDADLYVRASQAPDYGRWDCRPFRVGSSERCSIIAPPAGYAYVMIDGATAFSGLTLTATVFDGAAAPPPAPSSAAATNVAGPALRVTWRDNSVTESSFRVRRRTYLGSDYGPYSTVAALPAGTVQYVDGTVAAGGRYRYQIQACNHLGCTSAPLSPGVTVGPPAPVTALSGRPVSGRRIDLSWTSGGGDVSTRRVLRGVWNGSGYGSDQLLATLPAATIAFVDNGVSPGGRYRYRVESCNGGGCSGPATAEITVPTVPPPVTGLAAAPVSAGLRLSWQPAAGDWFLVRRSVRAGDGSYSAMMPLAQVGGGAAEYVDATAAHGATYIYGVYACTVAGCAAARTPATTSP